MSRYSTRREFNNFKKSRKSAGSRIVAIGDLSAQLKGREPVVRRARFPIFFIDLIRFFKSYDAERSAIDPRLVQKLL